MSTKAKYSRRQVIAALMKMLKSSASTEHVAQVLANYLIETRSTRAVELYLKDLELEIAKEFDKTTAYIYSAKPLSQQIEEKAKSFIRSATGTKNIELITKEDPSLVGGIIIKTADAELDCSVRTKLLKLRSI